MQGRISLGILMVALTVGGCERRRGGTAPASVASLGAALHPPALVVALRRLPGVHFKGTARFRVTVQGGAAAGKPLAPEAITTETRLWLDREGHFRLVESNDHDGGREVIGHGRSLAVALRHGKMVRRTAREPEPTKILEEAVGAPWAAWETVQREATLAAEGGVLRLRRAEPAISSSGPEPSADQSPPSPLRHWRETVAVQSLAGEARLDPATGALRSFEMSARFTARRDGQPLSGELAVTAVLEDIGTTAAIAEPEAEELSLRQRTILDERALLGDLVKGKKTR